MNPISAQYTSLFYSNSLQLMISHVWVFFNRIKVPVQHAILFLVNLTALMEVLTYAHLFYILSSGPDDSHYLISETRESYSIKLSV